MQLWAKIYRYWNTVCENTILKHDMWKLWTVIQQSYVYRLRYRVILIYTEHTCLGGKGGPKIIKSKFSFNTKYKCLWIIRIGHYSAEKAHRWSAANWWNQRIPSGNPRSAPQIQNLTRLLTISPPVRELWRWIMARKSFQHNIVMSQWRWSLDIKRAPSSFYCIRRVWNFVILVNLYHP